MKKITYKSITAMMMAGAFSLAMSSCGNGGNSAATGTDSSASGSTSTMATTTPPAMPADTSHPATAAPAAQGMTDQDFITKASAANLAEINAHKAAGSHAMSAEVKSLAKHMLADHEKLGSDVKAYAAKKKLTVSTEPPADKKQMLDDVNSKKGKDWDAAYLDAQEADHKEVIAMFQSAQGSVTDPELKDMITKTIPQLQMHLQMVQDTKSKMNSMK